MADKTRFTSSNLSKIGSLNAMTERQTGLVYYVGIGGDDRDDGLTWPTRRLTVASGYGLCTNGDTLLIGAGTFTEDLTFDTDGVAIKGIGAGNGTTLGGTIISGSHTVTAGSNIFKDITFYDTDTAGVVITIGNDANSDYNQFIDCSVIAEGTCTVGLHVDGTAGGSNNTIKNCFFAQGNTACLVIDTGAVINNLIENCKFQVDSTANGHGIHVNHATAVDNIIKDCIVNGNGSTGTGIYIQAGADNHVIGCAVEDCTTLYDIAATNYAINCHEESQITADNTIQADLEAIKTDVETVIAAVGGPALQLRVEQSEAGPAEEDGMVGFGISIFDIDAGAIAAVDIDIVTGLVQTMEKSTGGAAFAVGAITQPIFAKIAGFVYYDYRFLAGEWEIGDMYKLTVSGITATIDGDTAYIKTLVWSGVILEELNVEAKIDAIKAETVLIVEDTAVIGALGAGLTDLGGMSDGMKGEVNAEVDSALDTIVPAAPTAGSINDVLSIASGANTFDKATDSLEAIADSVATGTIQVEADAGTTATSIIDAAALTHGTDDWFVGATLISINGQNTGQARPVVSFDTATDALLVYPGFLNVPDAGDDFLLVSSWRPHVLDQQPDVAVNTNANIAVVNIFDLNTAGVTYIVNNLRIKSVDPGANTVTITLKELINNVSTTVDTFDITTVNFGSHFSLYDMFSVQQLAGDDIQVTVSCDADGDHVITGQYQYAQAYTG